MAWYIYFLRSENKRWYYVGSTNRLKERLKEHNLGKVHSTKLHRPLKLVYSYELTIEKEARDYEGKIKDVRKEKERIIRIIEDRK